MDEEKQFDIKGEEARIEHSLGSQSPDVAPGELATLDHGAKNIIVEIPHTETARILRKVDFRLVPLLAFLYLVAFVDRSNIGNAKIAGLTDDLKMKGLMYNAAVTIFFPPYALLEVPSNIVLKLLRPSIWIAILMFLWGLCMTMMGLVKSYHGLLAARFFLGVTESGFFPAATYLLTIWYLRYEVQRRMAVFYIAASLSGAFSGLLAFAIEKMNGIRGMGGWQWIFILEGLVPIAISFVIWKVLPDSPETASFLEKHEKEFIINRLALETGSGHGRVTNADRIRPFHVLEAFKEWKIYIAIVMFWGNTIGTYGFTATVPTVINQLGYTSAQAQLMTIPIYVSASIMTLIFAWWSDYAQQRSPFIIGGFSIAVIGFVAQLAIPHEKWPGLTYGFLFPVAMGLYCPFIMIVAWIGNNLAPSSKRAVGMALLISVGNLGGIAGSNVYLSREAPKYHTGFGVCLAISCCAIIAAITLRLAIQRVNRKRMTYLDEHGEDEIRSRYTEQELLDMGDRSPFFKYTL